MFSQQHRRPTRSPPNTKLSTFETLVPEGEREGEGDAAPDRDPVVRVHAACDGLWQQEQA